MDKSGKKQLFFHVGMPKTASTFLQKYVFPHFKDILFIKKHDFKHHQKIINNTKSDKILLSHEINLDAAGGYRKMQTIAEHYPGTHPIIVLRRHSSWVKSRYKYYLRKHGELSFDTYLDLENERGKIKHQNLHYFDKIKILEHAFGCRPLVLFQEELKQNPEQFIAQLAQFINTRYNPNDIRIKTIKGSYSEHQLKYVRRFNRWYKFDNSPKRKKWQKFVYKKFSSLLVHSVAFAGNFLPPPSEDKPLIPEAVMQELDQQFYNDWEQCLEYAKQDRTLLF